MTTTQAPLVFAIGPLGEGRPLRQNAHLIEDAARLGYLRAGVRTLDPTYGKGRFWTRWQPDELVRCDLNPLRSPDVDGGVDATDLPFEDASFGQVVLDGPYQFNGTTGYGGPASKDEDYGVEVPARWQDRIALIERMIDEAARVLGEPERKALPKTLLVKCQDQVVSGAKRWQTDIFTRRAESLGFVKRDVMLLPGSVEQPPGRRQVHVRADYSTLLIFQKGPRRR